MSKYGTGLTKFKNMKLFSEKIPKNNPKIDVGADL